MEPKIFIPAIRVTGDRTEGVVDEVVTEIPVRLELNGEQLVTLLCTPTELLGLAIGFLLSEGLVRSRADITELQVSTSDSRVSVRIASLPGDWKKLFETRAISSGCGKGVTFTNYDRSRDRRLTTNGPLLSTADIGRLLGVFRDLSVLHRETGGVHSAALSDGKDILLFSEDIGRHNAVDKLLGRAFLSDLSARDKVLITSGRITSEIATKAGRSGIPVIISRAAPSCMAINYAEDMGITLVGFARGDRMNIYTWPGRIAIG